MAGILAGSVWVCFHSAIAATQGTVLIISSIVGPSDCASKGLGATLPARQVECSGCAEFARCLAADSTRQRCRPLESTVISLLRTTLCCQERRTGSRCLLPHARARTALLRLSLASFNTTLPPRRHERRNKEHTTAGINGLSYPRLAGVTVCAPRPSVRSL